MIIEELTEKQKAFLPKWRTRSLQIGVDTGKTNYKKAESCISYFYHRIDKKNPEFIWCDSPLTANLLINVLKNSNSASIGDSLGDSLWASLDASLGTSLNASLNASIGDSLGDSLWASLDASLDASLSASLWASIGDSIGASLRDSIGASLNASLRESLRASLRDSLNASLRESIEKKQLKYYGTYFWGQQENFWIAFYLFCKIIGVKYEKQNYQILLKYNALAKSCFWFYPFENVCVAVRKPKTIKLNSDNKKHADGEPAIEFNDGWKLWALNDVIVSQKIAETSAEKLDPQLVFSEKNVEVRREILRKIGLEKFLKNTVNKTLDKIDGYELLEFDLPDKKARALKMKSPSIGTYHIEGVPPNTNTCIEALNWRNQANYLPEKIT